MINNYPYFGFPNYINYMNTGIYSQPFNKNIRQADSHIESCRQKPQYKQYNINNNRKYNYYSQNANSSSIRNKCYSPNFKNIGGNNFYYKNLGDKTSNCNNSNHKNSECSNDSPIFNILGLNLFFDDVLIICIIFFLYNENVNDPYLFFTLVLLLLQ